MNKQLPIWFTGGFALGLVGMVSANSRQSAELGTPPDLAPGTKIYQIDVTADSHNVLASMPVTEPIVVKDLRGGWIFVEVPDLPHGPVWLNTAQVVYYRTTKSN
jgi:hypothetical protein